MVDRIGLWNAEKEIVTPRFIRGTAEVTFAVTARAVPEDVPETSGG